MPRLDTTILGGLPVTVEIAIARAEPDVGIFSDYVEDWSIETVGYKRRNPKHSDKAFHKKLEKKVRESEPDFETRLMEEYNDR
jgi:hypothetical protein